MAAQRTERHSRSLYQHTLSVLPPEILTKISSSLSIQDLARSYSTDGSWAKHVEDRLLEDINDTLRVVVFDDGFQTHCVWLPFAGFHKGVVSYREASCIDCPKSDELDMTLHCSGFIAGPMVHKDGCTATWT